MGNNDSLPPPPLPGSSPDLPPTPPRPVVPPPPPLSGGPVPPPAPPAVPQFPPTEPMPVQTGGAEFAPTTQMPSTLGQLAQPGGGQPYAGQATPGAGGTTPPGGVPPTGVPPASGGGKNNLPWIIAAAVAVVAVVVVAVVLLTGNDDTTSSPGTTVPITETSAAATSTTVAVTTTSVVPETTLAITTPSTSAPTPTTAQPGVNVFTDDTNTFTVLMLDTFQVDTSPTVRDGLTLANVTGSSDVAAFLDGSNLDLFGVAVSVGPTAQLPSAEELLASADPGDAVCTSRTPENDYPTLVGTAQVLLLDGCGTGGLSGQVAMVIPINGTDLTMLVYVRGPGPPNTDLFNFAQAVAESVVIL